MTSTRQMPGESFASATNTSTGAPRRTLAGGPRRGPFMHCVFGASTDIDPFGRTTLMSQTTCTSPTEFGSGLAKKISVVSFPPRRTSFASLKRGVTVEGVSHFWLQSWSVVTTSQAPNPPIERRDSLSGTVVPSGVRQIPLAGWPSAVPAAHATIATIGVMRFMMPNVHGERRAPFLRASCSTVLLDDCGCHVVRC